MVSPSQEALIDSLKTLCDFCIPDAVKRISLCSMTAPKVDAGNGLDVKKVPSENWPAAVGTEKL